MYQRCVSNNIQWQQFVNMSWIFDACDVALQRWWQFPGFHEHVCYRVVEWTSAVDVSGRRQNLLHARRATFSIRRPEMRHRLHFMDVSRVQTQRYVQRDWNSGQLLQAQEPGVVRRQNHCGSTGTGSSTVSYDDFHNGEEAEPYIVNTLRGKNVFHAPKVNRFGWHLKQCEPNVGDWSWQILGAIRAVATVWEGRFSKKRKNC